MCSFSTCTAHAVDSFLFMLIVPLIRQVVLFPHMISNYFFPHEFFFPMFYVVFIFFTCYSFNVTCLLGFTCRSTFTCLSHLIPYYYEIYVIFFPPNNGRKSWAFLHGSTVLGLLRAPSGFGV